jgi:hypothetical protein
MFKTPEDRLSEIQLYELVAEELEQGEQSKGLWAKALADGEGNIEKAKGLYIKLRVQMIKDQWAQSDKVRAENVESKRTSLLGERKLQRKRAKAERKRLEASQRIFEEKAREATEEKAREWRESINKKEAKSDFDPNNLRRHPLVTVFWWLMIISVFVLVVVSFLE